jgi:hypothetical protein
MLEHDEIISLFDETYTKNFKDIEKPLHRLPDVNLLLMLSNFFPTKTFLIGGSSHEVIYLNIDLDDLTILSKNDILDLIRSGLVYGSDDDVFYFFS